MMIKKTKIKFSGGPTAKIAPASPALTEAHLESYRDRLLSVRQAAAALEQTMRRNISAMPIVVSYQARSLSVRQVTAQSGDVVFEFSKSIVPFEDGCSSIRDAYELRDEFLGVTTERQALDFLREAGDMLPNSSYRQISWIDFKRWQRYAELVSCDRDKLSIAHKFILGTRSGGTRVVPPDELAQVLQMMAGTPHTYFSDTIPLLNQDIQSNFRRAKANIALAQGDTIEQAQERFLTEHKDDGILMLRPNQRELEQWFRAPPPSACSIEFVPLELESLKMQRSDALSPYLMDQDEVQPVLIIRTSCALEAIAAAIYADRVAGVRIERCPGCGKLFGVEARKTKSYCSEQCRNRSKMRRHRNKF